MTIFEALNSAYERLRAAQAAVPGSEQNPKLDAQVLLAHVLGKGTAYVFAHSGEPLLQHHEQAFFELVARRERHEPVAYMLGEKEFYRRPFRVTTDVLIPRPDTEVLVDLARDLIREKSLVVDVGTGSGAIAVTLALETGRPVVGIDESEAALAVAEGNAKTLGAKTAVFFHGHLLEPLMKESNGESLGEHLLVAANLPYISNEQYANLDPDVRVYEPRSALVSGPDGLDHYRALFAQIAKWRLLLPQQLDILIEIDPSQKQAAMQMIRTMFVQAHVVTHNDMAGRARVIHAKV